MPPVVGSTTHVVDGLRGRRDELAKLLQSRGLAVHVALPEPVLLEHLLDECFSFCGPDRRGSGGADADANVLSLGIDGQGERTDRDHHRVSGPDLRELLGPAGRLDKKSRDQLIGTHGVLLRACEELVRRHLAGALGRGELDDRFGGEKGRMCVARGRCGAEVAAYSAAVADLRRAHSAGCHRQSGQAVAELIDDARVGVAGADAQAAVVHPPLGQLLDVRQVDDRGWPAVVEVDLHHQVGPARNRNRLGLRGLHGQRFRPGRGLQELHRLPG